MLNAASEELGLSGPAHDKFIAGQWQGGTDAQGNLIEINKQNQTVTPVTQNGQPVQSYQTTQEAGRNQRAAAAQAGATQRAGMRSGTQSGAALARTQRRLQQMAPLAAQYKQQRDFVNDLTKPLPARQRKQAEMQATRQQLEIGYGDLGGFDETGNFITKPVNTAAPAAPSRAAPTTHGFSIGQWLQRNPGKTEADAREFAKQNYPNYTIIP
jgi:hypothetical protein